MAMCVVISLERFQVPPSCVPLPSTMHIMSGVMKPLLTPVGVQMVRDPVCGTFVLPDRAVTFVDGRTHLFFCSDACRDAYRKRTA